MQEHAERLTPSLVYWTLPVLTGIFGALVLAPFGVLAAATGAVAALVAVALLLARGAALVAVAGGELRVDRAHIPVSFISRVEPLTAAEAKDALGPGLDARAFVCTRPWVATAVRAHLADPADATPYWLIATRRPRELTAAITAARKTAQAAHSEQTN